MGEDDGENLAEGSASHARELGACLSTGQSSHTRAMAGSPLKRQRKAGTRAADGSVIAFPRLTHPRAGLSNAQWRALSPGEKVERLLNMPLDRAA
jgi:hypothetical protein